MCTALSIALCWCPKAGKVPSRIYWDWICSTMVRTLRSLGMMKSVSQWMLKWNSANIKNIGAGRASSSTFCDCTRQPLVYPRVYSPGPLVVSGHQGSIPEARCPGSRGGDLHCFWVAPSSAPRPGTQGQALVGDHPEHINRKLCFVCYNVTRTMLPEVRCWGQVGKSQRRRRDIYQKVVSSLWSLGSPTVYQQIMTERKKVNLKLTKEGTYSPPTDV